MYNFDHAGSHFYGTEYEIWANFEPVGNTEKKIGAVKFTTFEDGFLMFSCAKKLDIVQTKKLHNIYCI